jgi:hypothetical protein
MNKILKETRMDSYKGIQEVSKTRQELCIDMITKLGGKATANEITMELYLGGHILSYDTNYAKPRLHELLENEVVEVIGKKKDSISGRSCAIYTIKNTHLS